MFFKQGTDLIFRIYTDRYIHCLFLLCVCLSLSACGSAPGRLVGSKSFNHATLKSGGIVVAGVTSARQALSMRQRRQYSELLTNAFAQKNPEFRMVNSQAALNALGKPLYTQMLDSFRFHSAGSAAFMNVIQQQIPTARYLIYARIENDQTQYKYEQYPASNKVAAYVNLNSVRLMGVNLMIYDMQDRHTLVWAAGLQDVMETRRKVFGRYQENELQALMPEPPATASLIQKVFLGLADKMPKQ